MSIRNFSHMIRALALGVAVAVPLSAAAQNEQETRRNSQESRENEDSKKEEKDKTRSLAVFELEHRDPQQLNQIIMLAEKTSSSAQAHAATRQARATQPAAGTLGRTTLGYRGTTGNKDQLVTAVNSEQKILFVRGSDEQIKKVEELVKAFDVEVQDVKRHTYEDVRLIPVRGSSASQVQSTLSQLNLQGQLLPMGDVSLIVFRADDSNQEKIEQAEQVIEKLNARAEDSSNSSSSDNDNEGDE